MEKDTLLGMTEEDIIAIADTLGDRVDKNAPGKSDTYDGFFKLFSDGSELLKLDKEFVDYMKSGSEKQ
jgi:hypothetical protein